MTVEVTQADIDAATALACEKWEGLSPREFASLFAEHFARRAQQAVVDARLSTTTRVDATDGEREAVAAEREACAKVVEAQIKSAQDAYDLISVQSEIPVAEPVFSCLGLMRIAAEIRGRQPAVTAAPQDSGPGWDEDGMCDDHGRFACKKCALSRSPTAPAAEADEVGRQQARADQQAEWAIREAQNAIALGNEVELLREALRNFLAEADAGYVSVETDRLARTALNRADNAEGSDHAQP